MNNKIKEAFEEIHAEEMLKNKTRNHMFQQIKKRKKRLIEYRVVPVICSIVILFGLGGTGVWFHTPVSAISVDADSSIQLQLNSFGKVVAIESFNDKGQELVESVNVKYKNYQDAIEEIISTETSNKEETELDFLITVSGNNQEDCLEMIDNMESCVNLANENVDCTWEKTSVVNEAQKAGMTPGKYRAYQELVKYGSEITPEEACQMSMKEIRQCIHECQGRNFKQQGYCHNSESSHHKNSSGKRNGK